jgi:hypothetical protein
MTTKPIQLSEWEMRTIETGLSLLYDKAHETELASLQCKIHLAETITVHVLLVSPQEEGNKV